MQKVVEKSLSILLIGLLCFEAIFRVPFLVDPVRALELPRHEDLVSIIVETSMHQEITDEIEKYASRIQAQLPDTRVLIFPVDSDTHPYIISLLNERLYFSGQPDRSRSVTQKLAGTILIGDVPLPVVTKGSSSFPSIFPYVDFDEPHFFYDTGDERFEYVSEVREHPQADIWHSVIRPNTGDFAQDAAKLVEFFERVYEFDAGEGRYENLYDDPQVLYLDSYREAQALGRGRWEAYRQLALQYAQNITYHWYSRSFAQYLTETYRLILESEGNYQAPHFNDWDTRSEDVSFLDNVGDITTKRIVDEMVPTFIDVINEKYLGEIAAYVHNTGRYYNGRADVRMDSLPEIITKKDLAAREVLRQFNDLLENQINTLIETKLARDIPVLVRENVSQTITERQRVGDEFRNVTRTYNFVYDNYMYGRKTSSMTDASQCSITLGSEYRPGEKYIVEANQGHNPLSVNANSAFLARDANAGIVCGTDRGAMTRSYWGGNSMLNASFVDGQPQLGSHHYGSFTESIFDINGSKLLSANSPLRVSRPSDCYSHHMIMRPYFHDGIERDYFWPTETRGSRYTCQTNIGGSIPNPFSLDVTREYSLRFESIVDTCGGSDGSITLLRSDGSTQATCTGSDRRLTFKRLSSPVYHVSPTDAEYGSQLTAISVPNLPIDSTRYVSFIGLTGSEESYNYPNLFSLEFDALDTIDDIDATVRNHLSSYSQDINTLITKVDPRNLSQSERSLALSLSSIGNLANYPSADVDLAALISSDPEIYAKLLDAIDWLRLDSLPEKYDRALSGALDYEGTVVEQLSDPSQKEFYEIAYLGGLGNAQNMFIDMFPEAKLGPSSDVVAALEDQANAQDAIREALGDYETLLQATVGNEGSGSVQVSGGGGGGASEFGLSESEQRELTEGGADSESQSGCAPEGSVVIWEWPAAIQCWLAEELDIEWEASDHESDTSIFDAYFELINSPYEDPFSDTSFETLYTRQGSVVSPLILQSSTSTGSSTGIAPLDRAPLTYSDNDQDGVPDTYEQDSTYDLELRGDGGVYAHREGGNLSIHILNSEGKQVDDSISKVTLETIRIDDLSGDQIVTYQPSNTDDWATFSKTFVSYLQTPVHLSRGSNKTLFTTGSKDANIYLRAHLIDNDGNQILSSGLHRVRIRDRAFQVISHATDGSGAFALSTTYTVGDEQGVEFQFVPRASEQGWQSPMDILVVDAITGETVYSRANVPVDGDKYHMHFDTHEELLTRAGQYTFTFTDNADQAVSHTMAFLPGAPDSIQVVGNRALVNNTYNIMLLELRDRYGNLAFGTPGTLTIQSTQKADMVAANVSVQNASEVTVSTIGGRIPFQISPETAGDLRLDFSLAIGEDSPTLSASDHRVIDSVNIRLLTDEQDFRVGGQQHEVQVILTEGNGRLLTDFDLVLPVFADSRYATVQSPVIINKGRGTLSLVTGTKTTEALDITASLDGPFTFEGNRISIRSGEPIGIDLQSNTNEFVSSFPGEAQISLSLYDQYGNPYDGPNTYPITIENLDPHLISLASSGVTFSVGSQGVDGIIASHLGQGGIAYLRAYLSDQSKIPEGFIASTDVLVYTIHHALYKDNVAPLTLNTLKTNLLGGAYGDFTSQDYLGGVFLYENSDSRNLAVTSLVTDPYIRDRWFRVEPTGEILLDTQLGILTPEVDVTLHDSGYIDLDIVEPLTQKVVSTLSPRFNTQSFTYHGCSADTIIDGSCGELPSDSYVFIAPYEGIEVSGDIGGIYLTQDGRTILTLSADGRISGDVDRLVWTPSMSRSSLSLQMYAADDFIGVLEMSFGEGAQTVSSTDTLPDYSGLFMSTCDDCTLRSSYTGDSTSEALAYEVISANSLNQVLINNDYLGGGTGRGYARYLESDGLGWHDADMDLLDFSAGEISAKSLQSYQDYITIHLGDPLVKLDAKKNYTHGFDRTVGEAIYTSSTPIHDIVYEDINNDNLGDLIVFHSDGTIGMRVDPGDENHDIGDVAQILDMDEDKKGVGDFYGDGYPDIAFATDAGALQILENNAGVMTRENPQFDIDIDLGPIMHLAVFDMDADGLDDIVVVDRLGSLYIFYGDSSGIFTVQFIENAFALQIDDAQSSQYFTGSVRYEGAGGIGENTLAATDPIISSVVYDFIQGGGGSGDSVAYAPVSLGQEVTESYDVDLFGFFRMDESTTTRQDQINAVYDSLQNQYPDSIRVVGPSDGTSTPVARFIKSPFISDVLDIQKQFLAEDPDAVGFGDEVQIVLTVQNASDETISNLQVLDENPGILTQEGETVLQRKLNQEVLTDGSYTLVSSSPVSALIDLSDITLSPGDTVEVRYTLSVRAFEYGDLKVGYLETVNDPNDGRELDSEDVRTIDPSLVAQFAQDPSLTLPEEDFVGIEQYGDIIFLPDSQCGQQYFLWRSHNDISRTYNKTFKGSTDGIARLIENGSSPFLDGNGGLQCLSDGTLGGDDSEDDEDGDSPDRTDFPDDLSWDYRIGANPSVGDRDVYVVDLFTMSSSQIAEFKQAGKKVVCYINAGALQDGSHGQGLSETDTVDGGEEFQQEWNEKFLDIRSVRVRNVMKSRISLAASKGCDGIEPDNIDAYDNGTALTSSDSVDYLEFLADEAHAKGLAIGLKNAVDIVPQVERFTDFAIVEECHAYGECDEYSPYTSSGKAVFSVEYEGACRTEPSDFSNITCDLSLEDECTLCSGGVGISTSQTFANPQTLSSSEHTNNSASALGNFIQGATEGSDISSAFDSEDDRDGLLDVYNTDSDGDEIPDREDDRYGSFVEVEGNKITIGENIGNYVEEINQLLSEIIKGLSCGFGDAGCISMPINWTANMPGNTFTFMGYAIKQLNQPPYACYKDVRCGYPIFSYPTGEDRDDQWPDESYGAGGAFDYESDSSEGSTDLADQNGLNDSPDATGSVTAKADSGFTGGLGISEYRLFIGATLTGAIAEAFCFGTNTEDNKSISRPGQFPVNFIGNCIFATQPLIQCEDDGSDEEFEPFDFEIEPFVEPPEACIDGDLLPGSDNSLLGDGSGSGSGDPCEDVFTQSVLTSLQADVGTLLSGTSASEEARDQVLALLSENPDILTSSLSSGSSFSPVSVSSSMPDPIDRLNGEPGIGLTIGGSGSAVDIAIGLGEEGLVYKGIEELFNINLNSIKAFPNFIMDWLARQVDEIVMSLADLPDIQLVLPEFSGLTDFGWQGALGGVGQAYRDGVDSVKKGSSSGNSSGTTCSGGTCSRNSSLGSDLLDSLAGGIVPSAHADDEEGGFLSDLGGTASNVGSSIANSSAVTTVRQQYAGLNNAMEALNSLPIINMQSQNVGLQIPWMGKEELQSWLVRNKAILQSWKDISGLVDASAVISSIESNIATVQSYMTLPEKLQEYLHWKEKYLYEILANVQAVQDLLGGWMYDNGLRFKGWVETFLLVTKLFELWQAILDVFLNYDLECGVCRNERWNLQHWLWIIIGAIIPEIPVIQMPRWPDIGLDLSNVNLNLNIAYPNLDFGVYPVSLPDAPNMNLTGFDVPPMPQFPALPNLPGLPDIPVISLPSLPNLPPAPSIPELSSAIELVLDIFKLVTLIQCLYRQIPLSPEWYLGTKVAHKTERQGYLPFDFLDVKIPTPQIEFIDKINIATELGLSYDTSFLVDALREAIGPLSGIQRNFSRIGDNIPSSVNIDLNNISLQENRLLDLIASLEHLDSLKGNMIDVDGAYEHLAALVDYLKEDSSGIDPATVQRIVALTTRPDMTPVHDYLAQLDQQRDDRFGGIISDIRSDLSQTQQDIRDLDEVIHGDKDLYDLDFLTEDTGRQTIQTSVQYDSVASHDSASEKLLASLPVGDLILPATTLFAAELDGSDNSILTDVETQEGSVPFIGKGIYVLNKYGRTQRLTDYTAGQDVRSTIMTDVDGDKDIDVLYVRGNTVYLKRHQDNAPVRTHITDRPRTYDQEDIYSDFVGEQYAEVFGVSPLARFLKSRSQSPGYISGKVLDDARRSHVRVFADQNLFSPAIQSSDVTYQLIYDVMDREGFYPNRVGALKNLLVRKIPAYIDDVDGAIRIYGPIKKMTLSKNNRYIDHELGEGGVFEENVRIRPAQKVFTGSGDVLIEFTWPDGTQERVRIPSHREVVFEQEGELRVLSGDIILMSQTRKMQALRAADLIDYPIDPGTHIEVLPGSDMRIVFDDESEIDLSAGQEWELVSSYEDIPWVSFRAQVENGFYYARIQDVFSQEKPRMLRQTLFSPKYAADFIGITASLPETIPVPALKTSTIDFSSYASIETIQDIRIDPVGEEDITYSQVSATVYEFGPFDSLEGHEIRVTYIDPAANASTYRTTLAPFAPPISITDATLTQDTLTVSGSSEVGADFPAQIYLYDETSPAPLVDTPLQFDDAGDFRTTISQTGAYFVLMDGDVTVLKIDKNTGHIYDIAEDYTVQFVAGDSDVASRFTVEDGEGEVIYEWYYRMVSPVFAQIGADRDISSLSAGIYLSSDHVRLIKASLEDPSIPNGAYIVDAYGKAIIAIDSRGYIYLLETDAVLEFREDTDSNLIRFASSEGVAEIRIIMDGLIISQ